MIASVSHLDHLHTVVNMTGNEQKKGQAETYPAMNGRGTEIGSRKVIVDIGGLMS